METILIFLNLGIIMIPGLIAGAIVMLPLIFVIIVYKILAPRDIFFTFGRENRAMYVMTGKKFSGRVILPSKTIYTDEKYQIKNFDDLPIEDREELIEEHKTHSLFGMQWIGIPPFNSIYQRRQQWLEWKSNEKGIREIQVRDEMTPFLICKPFEYAMTLEEGEDMNGVPLNVYFTVILMPVNAVLPIFGNDNAYGQVQTLCKAEVLSFVKKKSFLNLGDDKTNTSSKIKNDEFSKLICTLNKKIPGRPDKKGLRDVLGYEILDAKFDGVEVTGDHKEVILKATTAKYIASEEAKAEVEKAEGDKKSRVIRAQGEKEAIALEAEGKKIAGMLNIDVEKYSMKARNAFYKSIKDKPFGQQIELAKKMFSDSNLTTFVSGKDVTPTVNLGGK